MSKINELTLTFDENALFMDLVGIMVKAVNDVSLELLNLFRSEAMDGTKQFKEIDGFWMYVIEQGREAIVSYVGNYHWQAFLSNYGTGSLMASESENPWLAEYINSEYYNREREAYGRAVLSRPEGGYPQRDYATGHGEITRYGSGQVDADGNPKNLEESYGKNGVLFQKYKPQSPKFWLENSMQKIEKRFYDTIKEALDNFNWSSDKYLKGGV